MEVHYADEVYRRPDGIRDPFRWSRFSNPRFVLVGVFLALVVVLVAGNDRGAVTAGAGVAAGSHVAATAVRMAIGLSE